MVHIPATPAAGYHFVTNGVEDEGDDAHGVDTQFPWEAHPVWNHSHTIHLPAFWMDRFPVTVDEYAEYLRVTHYRPKDRINWLGTIAWDWTAGEPRPKAGAGRQPVTFVGLSEARRYCAWRGARLPQSYEWQWAAQGSDGRLYPWGNGTDALRHPKPVDGPHDPVPANVDAHPRGRSPFGVEDMVGKCVPRRRPLRGLLLTQRVLPVPRSVWQYTSEFVDEHTRAVVLRGSSRFQPAAFGESAWYFPAATQLTQHGKLLLMDDAYERAATLGFRCAAD